METRTITLSLPGEVLIKVRVVAARRKTSVSRILAQMLERLIQQEADHDRARRGHVQWLKDGADSGTRDEVLTGRDELHQRAQRP